MYNTQNITELNDEQIDLVNGGVLPLIALGVALIALGVTSFNNGYTVGRDIAERERRNR